MARKKCASTCRCRIDTCLPAGKELRLPSKHIYTHCPHNSCRVQNAIPPQQRHRTDRQIARGGTVLTGNGQCWKAACLSSGDTAGSREGGKNPCQTTGHSAGEVLNGLLGLENVAVSAMQHGDQR